jgi:hypothetical protein
MNVGNVFTALRSGYALRNSAGWKNRQIAVNSLAALLSAALAIAQGAGYGVAIDTDTLVTLAGGLWAVVGLFNGWATAATSTQVGLPGNGGTDPAASDASQGPDDQGTPLGG